MEKADVDRLVAQLRSPAGRKAALNSLKRSSPIALPDEVATVLRELLDDNEAADVRDDVITAILNNPTASLGDVYEQLARRELPYRRARALECLGMWMDLVGLERAERRILAPAARADEAWLRFLAAVQSARFGIDEGQGWKRAAKAIVDSRYPDPMRCIRLPAEEQLGLDERTRVNAELQTLGEPPLQ